MVHPMNPKLVAVVTLLSLTAAALAQSLTKPVEITREEAQKIVAYDLEKLADLGPAVAGQIVRLKFNYRSQSVDKDPSGKIMGTLRIWKYLPYVSRGDYIRSGSIDVIVPAEGAEWFMKLPRTESRSSLLVYARMPDDLKKGRAELLGREIKTDFKGSRIVW
jgi:hypothetical protein